MLDENEFSPDSMKRLRTMIEEAQNARIILDEMEEQRAKLDNRRKALLRDFIPELMAEMGVTEIVVDGKKVSLRQDLFISVTQPQSAYRWMDEHGYGGLIKTEVTVRFGRDEREQALHLMDKLVEEGEQVEYKEAVHHSTLKSWGRERLNAGDAIPSEFFNVGAFTEAQIKEK